MQIFQNLLKGKTIILVTHDHSIGAYAQRIISIKDGVIEGDKRVEMNILEAFRLALNSINAHKLRSVLTTLG